MSVTARHVGQLPQPAAVRVGDEDLGIAGAVGGEGYPNPVRRPGAEHVVIAAVGSRLSAGARIRQKEDGYEAEQRCNGDRRPLAWLRNPILRGLRGANLFVSSEQLRCSAPKDIGTAVTHPSPVVVRTPNSIEFGRVLFEFRDEGIAKTILETITSRALIYPCNETGQSPGRAHAREGEVANEELIEIVEEALREVSGGAGLSINPDGAA